MEENRTEQRAGLRRKKGFQESETRNLHPGYQKHARSGPISVLGISDSVRAGAMLAAIRGQHPHTQGERRDTGQSCLMPFPSVCFPMTAARLSEDSYSSPAFEELLALLCFLPSSSVWSWVAKWISKSLTLWFSTITPSIYCACALESLIPSSSWRFKHELLCYTLNPTSKIPFFNLKSPSHYLILHLSSLKGSSSVFLQHLPWILSKNSIFIVV